MNTFTGTFNFMQTTADDDDEFTQWNDLHKNNTLFDTSFRRGY